MLEVTFPTKRPDAGAWVVKCPRCGGRMLDTDGELCPGCQEAQALDDLNNPDYQEAAWHEQ